MDGFTLSRTPHLGQRARVSLPFNGGKPKSVGYGWATLVLEMCDSPDDLRTLKVWARFAGVSYSSLCERCRLVGVRPHDARDFARALRALIQSSKHDCQPDMLLDISDRRTLQRFLARAGVVFKRTGGPVSVEVFVRQQSFIPVTNEALKLLLRLFSDRIGDDV